MTAILENDILYRAREQALYGAEHMFNGLHPRLSYDEGALIFRKRRSRVQAVIQTAFTRYCGTWLTNCPNDFLIP